MKVGINAYLCSSGSTYRRTGVHRYIHELVAALVRQDNAPDLMAYVQQKILDGGWSGVHQKVAPVPVGRAPARIGFELTGLPVLIRRSDVDVFHGPVNTVPMGIGVPAVVTVHDLAFLRFPEQVTARRYRYLKRMIGSSVRRSRLVLTPSEATRADVIERYGVAPERVVVTPLGVDTRYQASTSTDVREQLGLRRPFVLYVGTIEPRKNLPRLIDASNHVQDEFEHDLVLAGPDGWLMDDVEQAIAGYRFAERLRRIGFVDDDVLAGLYREADVVAIPSLYEGFGLPVLEALSVGAVVLTSSVSSLPEVAGDAAELVDPRSIDAIADGLRRLLWDETRRSELRVLGPRRAAEFTWDRTAHLTLAAYEAALT